MNQSTSDSIRQIMPIFSEVLSRSSMKAQMSKKSSKRLHWRAFTPLVVLWGFIFQRLNAEHTCDAYVDYLHAGGGDLLDPQDLHLKRLSERLQSESTSAYVQGRNRLTLEMITYARQAIHQETEKWLGSAGQWHGHLVRILDGTTIRLEPFGDLVSTYGRSRNHLGINHWVVPRILAAFDLVSQTVVSSVLAPYNSAETHLVWELLQQETIKGCIYIGDRIFGIYSVVQALRAASQEGIIRLTEQRAKALAKRAGDRRIRPGETRLIHWKPTRHDKTFDYLSAPAIPGRLLYFRLTKPGYREVKTTMHMETLKVRSAALFRKEFEAGLLAYNLVRAFMTRAACSVKLRPIALSFSKCLRRVHRFLFFGGPDRLRQSVLPTLFLKRLAKCTLPNQPNKVQHEPRKARKPPRVYPVLTGDRAIARQEVLDSLIIS